MFVRINHLNKTVNYINTHNILRMQVKNNQLAIYTVFRPKYSAYTLQFGSNEEATGFADRCTVRPKFITSVKKVERLDEASPNAQAIQAMAEWEEEQKAT